MNQTGRKLLNLSLSLWYLISCGNKAVFMDQVFRTTR